MNRFIPRRPDPLAGLSAAMLAALTHAVQGPLTRLGDGYGIVGSGRRHSPSTIEALANRGLIRVASSGPNCPRAYRLTASGGACAIEHGRRLAARQSLIAERPERAAIAPASP